MSEVFPFRKSLHLPQTHHAQMVNIGNGGVNVQQNSSGLIAIDDGGFTTCVVTRKGNHMYPSVKGSYGVRNISTLKSPYDFIVEYEGEKYVMGELAKYDCAIPLEMHSRSKQHLFFDLSVLVSIHQFGYLKNYLVTSVPIRMHNEDEKNGRIQRLKRTHTIKVNDVTKTFIIEDVKVAPETASAFWMDKKEGTSRFIDIGSRTIGYATTIYENGITRFIDSESGTLFSKGIQSLGENYSPTGLADYIGGKLSKVFEPDETIYLLGGGALDTALIERLSQYFPHIIVLNHPQMVNALGMYELGRNAYGIS